MSDPPVKTPNETAPDAARDEKPTTPLKPGGVQFGPTPSPPGSRLKKGRP